jgi:hypothetical protein
MDTTPPAATLAEPSVPAVVPSTTVAGDEPPPPAPRSQPVNVAFLPLALAVFVIVAFVLAAWTFLAAG